jgi:predicted dehydrogenase
MWIHNIGIIGYGGFGQFLHNSWKQLENIKVRALADKVAWKYEGTEPVHAYSEWRNLIHDPDIEIVAIATVPYTHEMIASAAMEAGKAVLIEKPIATTISDARKLVEVQNRTGAIAGVDYIMRYNPLIRVLGKLTRENILGTLRRVDVENYAQDEKLPPDHWFWKPELAGGILIEHAVHFIDLVHSMVDATPIQVDGFAYKRNQTQEDQVMANVLYDTGLFATHYHSFSRPGFFENTTMRFTYDLAQIDIEGWIPLKGTLSALVNDKNRERLMELPGLEFDSSTPVEDVIDISRPKGWGATGQALASRHSVRSAGVEYQVDEMVTAHFGLAAQKQEIYAECVQFALLDVVDKIENPDHRMLVSLEDGVKSLQIAVKATESARSQLHY